MSFGHLMDVTPVMQEKGVLDALLQVYDDRNQCFKIRESMLPFMEEDVALILDLDYDGDIVSFTYERIQSEFEQIFLSKMHNYHSDAIKNNLFKLIRRKTVRKRYL